MRLLVVDDHEAVRRPVRSVLADRPGYEVCGEARLRLSGRLLQNSDACREDMETTIFRVVQECLTGPPPPFRQAKGQHTGCALRRRGHRGDSQSGKGHASLEGKWLVAAPAIRSRDPGNARTSEAVERSLGNSIE
jgi:hypothetical protein